MNFDQLLVGATSRIEQDYFNPPSICQNKLLKERVYCYELYHQLRCGWAGIKLTLHGEADKAGHNYAPVTDSVKPDFIVHRPGTSEGAVIVEVKRAQSLSEKAIKKDIEKLAKFSPYYEQFIFLVFGEDCSSVTKARVESLSDFAKDQHFQMWHHATPSQPATLVMGSAGKDLCSRF